MLPFVFQRSEIKSEFPFFFLHTGWISDKIVLGSLLAGVCPGFSNGGGGGAQKIMCAQPARSTIENLGDFQGYTFSRK